MGKILGFSILGIILLGLITVIPTYNGLIKADETADESWANVETAYQRRFDLIGNLVETVKGAADFEKSTLVAITEARAAAMGAMRKAGEDGSLGEFQTANQNLGVAMGRFFGYTENYPNLKANQNFLELQAQLEGTENRIAVARDRYNASVKEYNRKIRRFPGNMVNGMFLNLEKRDFFEATAGAEEAPQVNFTD